MAAPNALVAASQILTGERVDDPKGQRRSWQDEAWGFYDESGPLRYGTTWLANLLSRARLQAARLPPGGDEPEPIDSGPAAEAVEALAGGINGQAAMLRSCAIELTVPGICYLVGYEDPDEGEQVWRILSQDVIRMRSPATPNLDAVYEMQLGPKAWVELPTDSLIVKIWRPHERFYWEPDSPARAALGSLRELRRISQYIDATLVSRLSGAGIFIFPQEASFPTAPAPDGTTSSQHPFVTEIMNVMMTAVKQPGTAAQVVPIPVEVPGEHADKFKHLSFATELSDKILAMRESALRQASISLDIPAEILTGMGDVNHWGQWQIEESAIKVHAEPLLEIITAALTDGYLRPILEAGGEDATDLVIWADTSELTTRPDRSDDAIKLNESLIVSDDAALREAGLGDGDKPTDEEYELMLLRRLAIGSNPDLAKAAIKALGIELPEIAPVVTETPAASGEGDEPVDEDPSGAAGEGPPNDELQEPSDEEDFSVSQIIALEAYAIRALEKAGNRIRSAFRNTHELGECPPEQAHCCIGGIEDPDKYLANEWGRLFEVAQQLGLDPTVTVARCDSYCREIIKRGFAYDRASFILAMAGRFPVVVT